MLEGGIDARRLLGGAALVYLAALVANRCSVSVRGPSMEPGLRAGDRLLTVPAMRWTLRPGQVVVVRDPGRPGRLAVKRLSHLGPAGATVLGDAEDRSTDSRTWGPLPLGSIRRIAVVRLPRWGQARFGARRATTSSSGSSSATSPGPRRP